MKITTNLTTVFLAGAASAFGASLALSAPALAAPANSAFTGQNFYNCVVDAYNAENGTKHAHTYALTDQQLATIRDLSCTGSINQFSGLEKLTGLRSLDLSEVASTTYHDYNFAFAPYLEKLMLNNSVNTLNLRSNPRLTTLGINGNNPLRFHALDLSGNPALEELALLATLDQLDLSHNPNLTALGIAQSGHYAFHWDQLDLTKNTKLQMVLLIQEDETATSSSSIATIKASGLPELTTFIYGLGDSSTRPTVDLSGDSSLVLASLDGLLVDTGLTARTPTPDGTYSVDLSSLHFLGWGTIADTPAYTYDATTGTLKIRDASRYSGEVRVTTSSGHYDLRIPLQAGPVIDWGDPQLDLDALAKEIRSINQATGGKLSQAEIVARLTSGRYSNDVLTSALARADIRWSIQNATNRARALDTEFGGVLSARELQAELQNLGFTAAQAKYGTVHAGIRWSVNNAMNRAKLAKSLDKSLNTVSKMKAFLKSMGFTENQANHAAKRLGLKNA